MFRTNNEYRYVIDQEAIRLRFIQGYKVQVLEIAAVYIESNRTQQDKDKAIEELEVIRHKIMNIFANHIINNQL
jgi:hypothetical protein